jgi:hypothetical protein
MTTYGTLCGVYPANGTAGTEVSSTYEGRHLTFLESELTHPSHTDTFVEKGDPVLVTGGQIIGVSFKEAAAATDYVTIDTEGIWNLSVVATDDGGNSGVVPGDRIYINTTTCILSKIATAASQLPFGYALGTITSGQTATIAVKVHWDPIDNALLDVEPLYFGDARETNFAFKAGTLIPGATAEVLELDNLAVPSQSSALQIKAVGAGLKQDVGLAIYFDATLGPGTSTADWSYAAGIWLNVPDTYIASAGGWGGHEQLVALNLGVYAPVNVNMADADVIYGVKAEGIYDTKTNGCYFAALNVKLADPATRTAIFFSHNTQSVGLTAAKTVDGGAVALVDINGTMHWVNTFTG